MNGCSKLHIHIEYSCVVFASWIMTQCSNIDYMRRSRMHINRRALYGKRCAIHFFMGIINFRWSKVSLCMHVKIACCRSDAQPKFNYNYTCYHHSNYRTPSIHMALIKCHYTSNNEA